MKSLLIFVLGLIATCSQAETRVSPHKINNQEVGTAGSSRYKRGSHTRPELRKYKNGSLCPEDESALYEMGVLDNGGSENKINHKNNSMIVIRIVTMCVIFVISMAFGLLPLKTLHMKHKDRIASIANCFGGGVFFGTCFLHLIPEVKMQIKLFVQHLEDQYECQAPPPYVKVLQKFPLAEFLECSGFLLILSVEKMAESAKKIRPSIEWFAVFNCSATPKRKPQVCRKDSSMEADESGENRSASNPIGKSDESYYQVNGYDKVPSTSTPENPSESTKQKSAGLLIMALSIHSVFEGLAIGVESTPAVFLQLAAAITLHKCVIAFAVGSKLINTSKTKKEVAMLVGCMCVMTPIGILLAMAIVSNLEGNDVLIVSGTIQGVSTGFFLYITFAEMLFQEMENKHDSFLKVSFMSLGVVLVTGSTIWHNWSGMHAGH